MSIWNPFQKDRDLQQIEQLYRQYREPLWRYAYKLLHDEHLAQDVVQSVFIKAIEKSQLFSSLDCNKAKAYFVNYGKEPLLYPLPAAETPSSDSL